MSDILKCGENTMPLRKLQEGDGYMVIASL